MTLVYSFVLLSFVLNLKKVQPIVSDIFQKSLIMTQSVSHSVRLKMIEHALQITKLDLPLLNIKGVCFVPASFMYLRYI